MTAAVQKTLIVCAVLSCWALWILSTSWQLELVQRQLTALQTQVYAQQKQLDRLWVIDLGKP